MNSMRCYSILNCFVDAGAYRKGYYLSLTQTDSHDLLFKSEFEQDRVIIMGKVKVREINWKHFSLDVEPLSQNRLVFNLSGSSPRFMKLLKL